MDGEPEAVCPRQLAQRMRARLGRRDVTADMVRRGPFRGERGRDHPSAGQHDDAPAELAEEAATARARGDAPLRAFERGQLARRSGTSSILRSARSINPSTCSRLFTVPLARTTPERSKTSTNGVPGTSYTTLEVGIVQHHGRQADGRRGRADARRHLPADRACRGREQDHACGARAAHEDAIAVVVDPGHRGRRLTERGTFRIDLQRATRTEPQMERPHLPSQRHDHGGEDQHQDPLRDERRSPPPGHRIVQVGAFCSSMNWMNGLPSPARPTTARSSPS